MATPPRALSLPVLPTPPTPAGERRLVLVGLPNVGKTLLFNRLTGMRSRTANFAGTTVERRSGAWSPHGQRATLIDLPGLYGLSTDDGHTPDEAVAVAALYGGLHGQPRPDGAVVVLDATQLHRQLGLVAQLREHGLPSVVALNLWDRAKAEGMEVDLPRLARELGCAVVPISAKTGDGVAQLEEVVACELLGDAGACPSGANGAASLCPSCGGCPHQARFDWAERVCGVAIHRRGELSDRWTQRLDTALAHPWVGLLAFAGIAAGIFITLFQLATVPMDWIDAGFGWLGGVVGDALPEGLFNSFIVDGVIAGVGGVLVFLPQIVLLFGLLAILDDSGYLARAALVMDRLMARVGLPGKAFVPMLSAHACAIPAIMSTRTIDDRRDRLVTMLIIPLLTCSARLPVYAMITALLFADSPTTAGLVFFGCYALGLVAALTVGLVFRRTLLKGKPAPLLIELPPYRLPSLRNMAAVMLDRGWVFLKQAGTIIFALSVILWLAATFPQLPEERVIDTLSSSQRTEFVALQQAAEAGDEAAADAYHRMVASQQVAYSAAGRLGRALEPVFAPLGFTWQMNVGVVGSFAAREVFISTIAITYGLGDDAEDDGLIMSLQSQTRPDGTPAFTLATGLSLLVFYVLAMQCLPTQAVTRRESGSWKWPALQLGYMTALAYTAALVTYQVASALT